MAKSGLCLITSDKFLYKLTRLAFDPRMYNSLREGFKKKCVKLHTWMGGCFRSGTNYTEKTKKNMPLKSILDHFNSF